MADSKKRSIQDILAACRQEDGDGSGTEASTPAEEKSDTSAAPSEPTKSAPDASERPAAAAGSGKSPDQMSVTDVLAAARAGKSGGEKSTPAQKVQGPAKSKPKPAAKAGQSDKTSPKTAAGAAGPKDTSSILAAARKSVKPGPMSKSEAAARHKDPDTAKPTAKPKLTVPPRPEKPAYAVPKPKASVTADADRRGFLGIFLGSFLAVGFTSMSSVFGLWALGTARFMFPNILTEPPNQFTVGFSADFPPGMVDTKFKAQFGVWVVNAEYDGQPQIFALRTVCTHLGCTPNWLEAEQKFKCPCHGSGFYKDGINFEGPAPRPLERYAIQLADDGQLEVDKSRLFHEEMGQWRDSASFVPV